MKTNQIRLGKPKPVRYIAPALITAVALGVMGWFVIHQQGETYWVVTTDAPVGAKLSDLPLSKVSAHFAPTQKLYLDSETYPSGYLSQPIHAGELLSVANVSDNPSTGLSRVVVSTENALSASIIASSKVQVWVATRAGNDFGPASMLLENASVVRRVEPDTVFKQQAQLVELQVADESLPALLDAMATNSAIFLIASA